MQSDTFMLYKLMVLYILSRVNFPLTNAQLTAFILEKEYTNYFNLQRVISELIDDEYILTKTIRNSTLYRITEKGIETLLFFDNMISSGIKEDIEAYLVANKYELQAEVSTQSEFYQVKKGEYAAHLSVIERDASIIDLTLLVPTEEEAENLCNNWKEKSSDVYAYLMSTLL
jgi:predicted transcriptional regulator